MKRFNLLYFLYAVTIFLGSFLLFQVQPIIGKYILPWFGGTSFVWITSLLFFETLLLAGYFYAYLLSKLPVKPQFFIHGLLILLSFGAILLYFHLRQSPITPGLVEKPSEALPTILQVLIILVISVGLPYFLLATTSTLLQKWFSYFPHSKSPYSLYALSNIGSLLGLMSYPFLVEPFFSLQKQGIYWSQSFLIFCSFLFLCSGYALLLHRNVKKGNTQSTHFKHAPKQHMLLWFILPAISSMMLLAATNQLTQAIAPIPFLWLLPLCLYLISFILCFSNKKTYWRPLYALIFFVTTLIVLAILIQSISVPVVWQLAIYSLLLFSSFMLCHGELYAKKPQSEQLNIFYLLISAGSVLGAIIVAIIAPIYFVGLYWELYLAIYATALVAGIVLISLKNISFAKLLDKLFETKRTAKIFVVCIITGFFIIIGLLNFEMQKENSVGIWRNFYGTIRVTKQKTTDGTLLCLLNGKIIHGCQLKDKKLKKEPVTYYGKDSGIALAIQSLRTRNKNLRIGIIGLGIGTIAAYGEKGDRMTFYELNPKDIEVAKTQFSYLSDSQANISVIPGDGRLSLFEQMKKTDSAHDDLFVIDAFNDDAIPVHLLTKEAFALYLQNVVTHNAIIAVNISTTYINLSPVIKQLANHYHLAAAIITTNAKSDELSASRWALLSDNPKLLQTDEIQKRGQNLSSIKNIRSGLTITAIYFSC